MLDETDWAWFTECARADVDHLVVVSSLPVFVPGALHDLQVWDEAVAGGAWGRRAARLGERIRRELDLEDWPAFPRSFADVTALFDDLTATAAGPSSVTVISGDIHFSYLAEVVLPSGGRVHQVVCSPLRNALSPPERATIRVALSRPGRWIGRVLRRSVRREPPPCHWTLAAGPVFANCVGLATFDGDAAEVCVEQATLDDHRPTLSTVFTRTLTPDRLGADERGAPVLRVRPPGVPRRPMDLETTAHTARSDDGLLHEIGRSWPLDRSDAARLVAAFVAITAVWWGFGALIVGPFDDSVGRIDRRIAEDLAASRTPLLDDLSLIGSWLAETVVKVGFTSIAVLVMIAVWRRWREALFVALSLILEAACFLAITLLVGRPRPAVEQLDSSPVDSSFPSGHVAAAVVYAAFAVVVFLHTRAVWARVLAVVVTVLVAGVVAWARLYRGMHHLSDVLAGVVLGGVPGRHLGDPRPRHTTPRRRGEVAPVITAIVLCSAALTAAVAYLVSRSPRIEIDPIDVAVEQRAVESAIRRRPRLRVWIARRLDRTSAGGLLLTAAFAALVGTALVVGSLLDMIRGRAGLARWDMAVATFGADHADGFSREVAHVVTQLGARPLVLLVLAVAALVEYARSRDREVIAFVVVVGVGEMVLVNVLKVLVARERPDLLPVVSAHGWSFPSGHSSAAAAAWAAAALVVGRGRPRPTRTALACAAVLISTAVAASRALLGVHWLTDVIAGLALGWGGSPSPRSRSVVVASASAPPSRPPSPRCRAPRVARYGHEHRLRRARDARHARRHPRRHVATDRHP